MDNTIPSHYKHAKPENLPSTNYLKWTQDKHYQHHNLDYRVIKPMYLGTSRSSRSLERDGARGPARVATREHFFRFLLITIIWSWLSRFSSFGKYKMSREMCLCVEIFVWMVRTARSSSEDFEASFKNKKVFIHPAITMTIKNKTKITYKKN